MMKTNAVLFVLFAASCLSALGGVEKDHLKLYASFDRGVTPEIAADGFRLRKDAVLASVDGRYGGAVAIEKGASPDDLVYVTDRKDFGASGWTLAMWLCMNDGPNVNYGNRSFSRGIFSSNGGQPGRGAVSACLTCWIEFLLHRHPSSGSPRTMISSQAFVAKKWTHVAFVFHPDGKTDVYINGNEASYTEHNVATGLAPVSQLRIGSVWNNKDQLDGRVDELKVLDKALTAEEVREIKESLPLRRTADIALYLPCDGKIAGRGVASFSAVDLVFAKGFSYEGVKVVRHGYDRRVILSAAGLPVGTPSSSAFAYFRPDWPADEPADVRHGLWHAGAGDFSYGLEKNADGLVYTVRSGGKSASVRLTDVVWRKDGFSKVAAGYDFGRGRMFVSVDGIRREAAFDLPRPASVATGALTVGDVKGADYYSKTQAEGTLDEILVANEYLTGDALAEVVATEIAKKAKKEVLSVVNAPVKAQEEPLWDLGGAEREKTSTRERITLNALWRFQLTDEKRRFCETNWWYLPVPGRYSGQENGGADCEFFFRDGNLKRMPQTVCDGRDSFKFVNGWFERAFRADPSWKGRGIALRIEELSVTQSGTVFLNGKSLGTIPTGRQFIELPVPEHLLRFDGWNFLTVNAVDTGRRWSWRGIKGDVSFEICDRVHAENPEFVTSVKDGRLTTAVELVNDSSKDETLAVELTVKGPNAPAPVSLGTVTVAAGGRAEVRQSVGWKDAVPWDVDAPTLYTGVVTVKDAAGRVRDELPPVTFGFREFEIRGRDFYLNGKKIHLFINDQWQNQTDLASARETAKVFKRLGFNAVRMDFGGSEDRQESIFRACDETGLLYFPNVCGVSGREFALWNDPEVRKDLESRMRGRICAWRNHACAVMWYMSINFLGYTWGNHPLKMAEGYTSPGKEAKYRVCLEGVNFLRKYDRARRPYFFQAGCAFGEVHTSNSYFCWWPQTEREEWPEEWSKRGAKPMMPIETSFPYVRSFYGMDLLTPGVKPLFYFENLARYYGPSAYENGDPDMIAETRRPLKGREAVMWHDEPGYQRLKGDLLVDTIRSWRDYDLSGVCPFAEVGYAYARHAPRHTQYVAKTEKLPPRDFRRFGPTPDAVKYPYQNEIDPSRPLPVAAALAKCLAPKLAFFDGGAAEPADRCRHYRGGERLTKRLVLVNDTRKDVTFAGAWKLGAAGESFARTLAPGEKGSVEISVALPMVDEKTVLNLTADVRAPEALSVDALAVMVSPEPKADGIGDFALYDPVGRTAAKLTALGVKFTPVDDLAPVKKGLLVVGTESLTEAFARQAAAAKLAERVNAGDVRVLVMAQQPEQLARLGVRTTPVYARTAYDVRGRELGIWAGRGTLAPDCQPPDPKTEKNLGEQFFHWSNLNMLSSYPVLRPSDGPYEAILTCGKDLVYSPLIEMASGKGTIVFCQLEIESRTMSDVQADGLLLKILRRHTHPAAERPSVAKVVGAEDATALGVSVAETNIASFAVTAAGVGVLRTLSARDRFFRYPVGVKVFSGAGVTPLTEPAFLATKDVGGECVLLVGVPDDACAGYLAAGEKKGLQSSTLWAAETLDNRLRYVRSLAVCATGAAASGELAERLGRSFGKDERNAYPYGGWKSTYHTEKHITW